jgi:tetratricopeptide (TPR) repeat protein
VAMSLSRTKGSDDDPRQAEEGRRYHELGHALRASGRAAEAITAYQQGLGVAPDNASLHVSLGDILLAQGDIVHAAASYRHVLPLHPMHGEARIKLAHVLKLSADYAAAAGILRALAVDYPNNPAVLKEFGRLYFAQHRLDEARESFHKVIRITPHDADAHHWLANIEHLRGNPKVALGHYQRTIALKPFMRVPAIVTPPDFSILFLFSPGNANTPPDALVRMAEYESCFLLLLPDIDYDVEFLRNNVQAVVNLISDVEQGKEILPVAEKLVERIGLPVVNHPHAILKTDRESVATLLTGIPFCCVPQIRFVRGDCTTDCVSLLNRHFPLLMRVVGTHGGENFEKMNDWAAVGDFVARHPGADLYLTEYIDYQFADGFFRKYRFFFIADEILPYHLAIGDTWKVHHGTTDMANQPWMRREEEAFLNDPESIFHPRHFTALHSIRQTIGLDFCGIDCAIDQNGRLVVFEVNASMLVHQNNGPFPYKVTAVDRIKRAFDAMLRKTALPASVRPS